MDQGFLLTLVYINGNIVSNTLNNNEWNTIKKRVIFLCKDRDNGFKELAVALAKYDYCGAPSNWLPEYNHEKTIINWTEWAFTENNEYKYDVNKIIKEFHNGLIPDAFRLMIDYFC